MKKLKQKCWEAKGKCVDGGYGWGETGRTQSIGEIEGKNIKEALKNAKNTFPGGWEIISIKLHKCDIHCG